MKQTQEKSLSLLSKIMMTLISVLTAVMLVVAILDRFAGMCLISSHLMIQGTVVLVVMLIAWPLLVLAGRIRSRGVKVFVYVLLAMVLFMLTTFGMVLMTYFSQMWLPGKYAVFTTNAGEKIVIMRMLDTGIYDEDHGIASEQRMYERREAYLAQPDAEPLEEDEMPQSAYGYVYYAYPGELGVFYNSKADSQGEIYMGMESEARLLYERLDDGSLRIYIEDAEVGDSGEIILK